MLALKTYRFLTARAEFLLNSLLEKRVRLGKEMPERVNEKRGVASKERLEGKLLWLHAASVGEAQSALVILERLAKRYRDAQILVTTGTKTSAEFITPRLPENAVHQFYPLDHPQWVERFLDYWRPDFVLWMESELWPNMLAALCDRHIPAVLLNARMSKSSFHRWCWFSETIQRLLSAFTVVLAQSEEAERCYSALGAAEVHMPGNLKYSAHALQYDEKALQVMRSALLDRPLWLYASTHAGEEALACEVHQILKSVFPRLLTMIVPRHPERASDIHYMCENKGVRAVRRSVQTSPPDEDTDIYIADTLGELGLFYRLAPVSMIGRSFSDDGGGGHNPIEAAQLHSAVLSGPFVENFTDVYALMWGERAAVKVGHKDDLVGAVQALLSDEAALETLQKAGYRFAQDQRGVFERVESILLPLMDRSGFDASAAAAEVVGAQRSKIKGTT